MKIYNFMKYKNLWFSISGIILAIGIVFAVINGGLNFGIDFVGGSSIQIKFDQQFDLSQVKNVISKYDKEAIVTYAGNDNEMAQVRSKIGFNVEQQGQIKKDLKDTLNVDEGNIEFVFIGPTIGDELKKQALIALLLANIGILLYVSIRFEWKFGVAAILALVHDVGIMLALYAILQIPVNSTFIAAILTIVGYSINDTIVVFDRIRENSRHAKKISDDEMVNASTSQTVIRSINTSLTTLVTILALYIFGVTAIRDFALPLIVGIISGTYSSIFIASPLWAILRKKFNPVAIH
ncbi:MAG: protein translocase subunit SecF [Lutisporaceae bacterium]